MWCDLKWAVANPFLCRTSKTVTHFVIFLCPIMCARSYVIKMIKTFYDAFKFLCLTEGLHQVIFSLSLCPSFLCHSRFSLSAEFIVINSLIIWVDICWLFLVFMNRVHFCNLRPHIISISHLLMAVFIKTFVTNNKQTLTQTTHPLIYIIVCIPTWSQLY